MELEADHHRYAEAENAIRDLKYGVGLNHLLSGRLAANASWLAIQVIAHNLARWMAGWTVHRLFHWIAAQPSSGCSSVLLWMHTSQRVSSSGADRLVSTVTARRPVLG